MSSWTIWETRTTHYIPTDNKCNNVVEVEQYLLFEFERLEIHPKYFVYSYENIVVELIVIVLLSHVILTLM